MIMFYGGEMDNKMKEFSHKKFKISREREKESKLEYFRLHSDSYIIIINSIIHL